MGQLSPLRRGAAIEPAAITPAQAPLSAKAPALRPLAQDTLAVSAVRAKAPVGTMDVRALEDRISRETGTVVTQGNRIELHVDGKEAYPRIMATIRGAEKTLHMQMYIFKDDQASWDVADALAERAAHGVKVRLSADYVGSPTSSPVFEFLRANGVEVRHHATAGWQSQVDHRKIIIADGKTAMTGGMNIADEYRETWHDVMATIEGPAVHEMQREFLRGWQDHGGSPVTADDTVFAPAALKRHGQSAMRVVTTYPQPNFERSLFAALDAAQKQINVELPYFSDDALVDRLVAAAKRGVKVNLVLAGTSDVAVMDLAAKAHFQRLQSAGVKIHLYQGRVLHAKVVTVDGVWATMGSGNGDARSMRLHREMNVNVSDPAAVATIDKRIFEADFAASKPGDQYKMGLGKRMLARIVSWVSPLL
jgi:cardiolipin synthase